jgi:hypothetical protein
MTPVGAPETLGFGNRFRRTETVADAYCLGDTESVPDTKGFRSRFGEVDTVPDTEGFGWSK